MEVRIASEDLVTRNIDEIRRVNKGKSSPLQLEVKWGNGNLYY